MAGIGFRLQRVVAQGGYVRAVSTYVSSAVISAGPWISAMISISFLGTTSAAFLNSTQRSLLFATITYVFCVSLIVSYGMQLVVVRYLSDRLYLKQADDFAAVCAGVLCCAAPLLVIASPFLLLAPFEWRYRLVAVSLLLTVSLIWLTSAFLSATREYRYIVFDFVLGYALSFVVALELGRAYGALGSLTGFTIGQAICLALLVGHVYMEFPATPRISLAYLAYVKKFWDLFLIGILYACCLWTDNIVYWFSPYGQSIGGYFRVFPAYDSAKLVGFLLTIPAASVFLVHIETHIYRCFREYLNRVMQKGSLPDIHRAKENLTSAIWGGILNVAKLQTIVALGALLAAPGLAAVSGVPMQWIPTLRVVIVGASVQYVMVIGILLLLYLDYRSGALQTLTLFVSLCAILTAGSIYVRMPYFGMSYLIASIVGVLFTLWRLHGRLKQLVYVTFMLQPVG